MSKLGDIAHVTKLAGFEHTKYIQGNISHERSDKYDTPLFIGKTVRNGEIDKNYDWYLPHEISDMLPRSQLTKKCLVMPYVGSLGDLAVFYADERCHLGSNIAKIELNDDSGYSEEFVNYFVHSPYGQALLFKDVQGAIQKNITMESIRDIELPDIDKTIQDKIVEILKPIDDKIKLNKSICSDLEALAKEIYDYWFVQFDFPDENGKPYKSSGGKMVWNEELKREIPAMWTVTNLGKECELLLGGTPDTSKAEYWDGDIPWLNSGEVAFSPVLSAEKTITKEGMNNSATAFAKAGAVVMSITRYIRPSILGIAACFNQSVVAVKPTKTFHTSYLYPLMKSNVERYMKLRTGAQQPHINKETVENTIMLYPSATVLNDYYKIVENLYEQQLVVSKENQQLASLRDFLLPMLMNGQIKIEA